VKNTFNSVSSCANFSRGAGRVAKIKFEEEAQKKFLEGKPWVFFE
jgi:hypothetical protein